MSIRPPLKSMSADAARAWLKETCPGTRLPRVGRTLLVVLPGDLGVIEVNRANGGEEPARYTFTLSKGQP